jgi:hypothetical protein
MYLLQHIGAGLLIMLLGLGIFLEQRRHARGLVLEFFGVVAFTEGFLVATLFFLGYWQAFWYWP